MNKLFRGVKKIYQAFFYLFRFKHFGKGSVIEGFELLNNPKQIKIGSGVYIKKDARLEALEGGLILIGDNCHIERGISITCYSKVKVGNGCLFGRNVLVVDHSHNFEEPSMSPVTSGVTNVSPIEIGDNCWVGANAVLVSGAKLGKGCVVGANSVVTKKFQDYTLVAGVPAKVIKKLKKETKKWEKV